ncbi:hypothetical protein BDF20DRAFT_797541, partial [Mycotypha africana]|uniref:uncharacterized protein n=1 Tax=Mycotypha africana TaxID=64632 RepID=UPI0023008C46
QEPQQQGSADALSHYPQGTNINSFNGTWYITGATKNAWDVYQTLSQRFNIQIDCAQFDVNTTSNSTLDVLSSAFLNQTTLNLGINATVAGSLILQNPDSQTNVSNHELLWEAYTSQVFVNKGLWDKFTQKDQSNANNNNATTGATPLPGTKPVEATIYTQLIDTNAQPGTNTSTNFDAIFIWGSHAKTLGDDHNDIYGVLLTKNATISPDVFNRTAGLLPQRAVSNNAQLVQLNDTCTVR